MSQLSPERIHQEIGNIVAQFKNLECDRCAIAVMQWLKDRRLRAKLSSYERESVTIFLSSAIGLVLMNQLQTTEFIMESKLWVWFLTISLGKDCPARLGSTIFLVGVADLS
jgi:hypothetical protein